jgi:hypothetical protein
MNDNGRWKKLISLFLQNVPKTVKMLCRRLKSVRLREEKILNAEQTICKSNFSKRLFGSVATRKLITFTINLNRSDISGTDLNSWTNFQREFSSYLLQENTFTLFSHRIPLHYREQ